jgi:ATP-dependent RNA helicase DeaD
MTETTFRDLGLTEETCKALDGIGFINPTPIQENAIPVILNNKQDMIGQAATGTGKTAAFGLPMIDQITPRQGHVQALIVAPTRELALQVVKELEQLKGEKRLSIAAIYGGQSIERQRKQIKDGVDIIVATPGRVMDHIKSGKLRIANLSFLVLDEADEMLNAGFIDDIKWIMSKSNPDKQILLFSATMPAPIQDLAEREMKDPVIVSVKKDKSAPNLTEQTYMEVSNKDRLELLYRIMDIQEQFYGLIFCRTKRDVDKVAETLIAKGYGAEAMHGDLSQHQRERVLDKFRQKHVQVLVVTDVAARGLDITGLTHVINLGLPQDPESYVHRVGRTGRAGQTGSAITLIPPSDVYSMRRIEKATKMQIKQARIPSADEVNEFRKSRIRKNIEDSISTNKRLRFTDLAGELLEEHDPEVALAAVIKLYFEKELAERNYPEISVGNDGRSSRRPKGNFNPSRGNRGRGSGDRFRSSNKGGYKGKRNR